MEGAENLITTEVFELVARLKHCYLVTWTMNTNAGAKKYVVVVYGRDHAAYLHSATIGRFDRKDVALAFESYARVVLGIGR